jgi:hypothetical protein
MEEGSLNYDGGFVRLQIHMNFDTIIHRQQLLELLLSTTMCSGACRAYSPGTHERKDEDGLLLEFPCNPIWTRSV